ncbi:MAG: hypothetical protein OEY01_16485, partial [Desulfobulbaceae bacterium]|nr:hypothetical protein [Desulfobulbaceae bacterium]
MAYSAKELEAMRLPVLPTTGRNISLRADAEEWSFFWETVRGGQRKMYRAHILPDYVRQAILDKEEIDSLVPADRKPTISTEPVNEDQRTKAMARADLLRLYMQAVKSAAWGMKDQARDDFMTAYNSGIAYQDLFKSLGPVNWKTIEGWKRKLKKHGGDTMRLADRRGYH